MPFDANRLFLDWSGRVSRKEWWIGLLVLIVAAIAVLVVLGWLVFAIFGFGFFGRLLYFILTLPFIYVSTCLSAKRFQDRDKPGNLAWIAAALSLVSGLADVLGLSPFGFVRMLLGAVALVVGVWFLVELGFLRGTEGPNRYGPDPLGATTPARA